MKVLRLKMEEGKFVEYEVMEYGKSKRILMTANEWDEFWKVVILQKNETCRKIARHMGLSCGKIQLIKMIEAGEDEE